MKAMALVFVLVLLAVGQAWAADPNLAVGEVKIEQAPAEVVLYTIYRGPYERMGQAIGSLFMVAGQKQIQPQGPVTMVYLNCPKEVTPEHYLTEVRVPVGEEALQHAGQLGEMTDIKRLPAVEVMVVEKPVGVADPSPIYQYLMVWTARHGYLVAGGPRETMLGMGGPDYASMHTRIALPVVTLDQLQGD